MTAFDRRKQTHWLDNGTVACGASFTRDQFPERTTTGADGRTVNCQACIGKVRQRLRVMADPTAAEVDYVDMLERMIRF